MIDIIWTRFIFALMVCGRYHIDKIYIWSTSIEQILHRQDLYLVLVVSGVDGMWEILQDKIHIFGVIIQFYCIDKAYYCYLH